ncbi:Enamine deaminase RidA, house cleaning of reactive enamine intermediates, YjgF/YER057c/UK114 family [Algoriphagus faecimaris]|uniref:Enamine deaminase RidA, house cleaning of reactive enamine intermediates, YjgF/YER057c/UK114 family n=1 Tax=Algoriphagus faecimaris TaxID=686796 RepID=A0A1G6RYM7_9BACT|nr:RidA family protein [Algoriphagus faecimaris]SDD09689.1 Enamine deaminase RidA, house cleaning of reactive enamine intermediates, YjgF/YER057c/UK114 family [Algoriphagus faecimaris]
MKKFILIAMVLFGYSHFSQAQSPEEKLKALGLELPEVSQPMANYVKWKQVGNVLYLAGNGPDVYGKVGADLTPEQGYQAARETGLEILAVLKAATGDLSRIKQFVKVLGMVNSAPDFTGHPAVINGFSDLMVEVFGEKGKHARSAVGVAALPNDIAVEIEVIVELEDQ